MAFGKLSALNRRRWELFKRNRRGFWSFWLFLVLFVFSLLAPVIANDRPILVQYKGELLFPLIVDYPESRSLAGFLAQDRFSRSGEPGRDQCQWLDIVGADPLFLQHRQ